MGEVRRDDILALIARIYRAASAPEEWEPALAETARLTGGRGALLEVVRKPEGVHTLFHAQGVPLGEVDAYMAHYFAISPRLHYALRQPSGTVWSDYDFITEQEIARDESYDFSPATASSTASAACWRTTPAISAPSLSSAPPGRATQSGARSR